MANEISKGLDFLSRFLTAWIFIAMLIDIGIDYFAPGITQFILENYLDCHGSVSAGLYGRDSPKRKCRQMQRL